MLKWEYKVVTVPKGPGLSSEQLNELGKNSWDLVHVIPEKHDKISDGTDGYKKAIFFFTMKDTFSKGKS